MMVLACGYIYMEKEEWTKAAQVAQSVLEAHPQVVLLFFLTVNRGWFRTGLGGCC